MRNEYYMIKKIIDQQTSILRNIKSVLYNESLDSGWSTIVCLSLLVYYY